MKSVSNKNKLFYLAIFILGIWGLNSCDKSVDPNQPFVQNLDCAGVQFIKIPVVNKPFLDTVEIGYSGGNGKPYNITDTIRSTEVLGLNAVLISDTLNNGDGYISVIIVGTARSEGIALFEVNFGSKFCTLSLQVTNTTPSKANLIYPLPNAPCEKSNLVFRWTPTINTVNYKLTVINLLNPNVEYKNFTTDSFLSFNNLTENQPYEWYITSFNNIGDSTSSPKNRFYLSGSQTSNFAPFPAELLAPQQNYIVSNPITFEWTGSDPDNDIDYYTLYIDGLIFRDGLTQTRLIVNNTSLGTHNWQISTTDKQGNRSFSYTYNFIVR